MRIYFQISGAVQGIGYRWFAKDAAAARGLTGFVRNRGDDSVEGEAQGDKAAVESFIQRLKTGHPLAVIDSVKVVDKNNSVGETDFIIDSSY